MSNLVMKARRDKSDSAPEAEAFSMLWLVSYAFLLRVPSEALPIRKMKPTDEGADDQQSIIWRDKDDICLRLRTRKNRRSGSGVMRRKCSCPGGRSTCLVHTLWESWLIFWPDGEALWADLSPQYVIRRLRADLATMTFPVTDPEKYGTHDFRRGHAEDMRASGRPLADILQAGQWKSSAFLRYVDEATAKSCLLLRFAPPLCFRQNWRKTWPIMWPSTVKRRSGLTDQASQCSQEILLDSQLLCRKTHYCIAEQPSAGAVGFASSCPAMLRVGAVGFTLHNAGRLAFL